MDPVCTVLNPLGNGRITEIYPDFQMLTIDKYGGGYFGEINI